MPRLALRVKPQDRVELVGCVWLPRLIDSGAASSQLVGWCKYAHELHDNTHIMTCLMQSQFATYCHLGLHLFFGFTSAEVLTRAGQPVEPITEPVAA